MLIVEKDIFKIKNLNILLNSEFGMKDLRAAKKILKVKIVEI